MIPLATPVLDGNEACFLHECVTTGFVSSVGPFVDRFEAAVSAATGASCCFAAASGTAALHLALTAAGVQAGDLVIIPSYTFIASANAVAQCGAMPWICDIRADTWTLDAEMVAIMLRDQTRLQNGTCVHTATGRCVSAIMPVHTFGLAADMDQIIACARDRDLKVIVDAACAIGTTCGDRPVGAMGADLSVISFNGNKTITTGGGGAVVGNNSTLMDLVRHLGTTARRGPGYEHDMLGFNYRMTNLQAAVGCAQIERLDHFVATKRRIRACYDAAFKGMAGVAPFPGSPVSGNACWLSGLLTSDIDSANRLIAALEVAGVESKPFWKPIHLQSPFLDAPRTLQTVSESIWQRVVVLPSSTDLAEKDQNLVIAVVREVQT